MDTIVSTKPALGFAGVGWIGRHRLKAVADANTASIFSVYDPSPECVNQAINAVSTGIAVDSFHQLIHSHEVEGIVIATPSALHMEQAIAAFEAGKAVFCQKPLGRNAEEVTEVVKAAKKANKLLGADFSYRYTNAFARILPIIQSGELGDIFSIDLKFHNAYGPDKPWFYDVRSSGGGCVLDLGIHLVDLMLYALDFPAVNAVNSNLYRKGKRIDENIDVEDYAAVQMLLENDTSATLNCSWNLHAGCEAVIEASFYGTRGGVSFRNVNGSFYDFVAQRHWGTKTETLCEPPDAWGGRALVDWTKKLALNPDYSQEALQFIHSAKVVDRIYGR